MVDHAYTDILDVTEKIAAESTYSGFFKKIVSQNNSEKIRKGLRVDIIGHMA